MAPLLARQDKHILTPDTIDYESLFRTLPGRYIVFLPNDPEFTIVEETDAHATMAMVKRQQILDKPLFEVFPDTSEKYVKTGKSELVESFRRVIKTGKPDTMETLRYDIRRPDGSMAEKYWRITHYPVAEPGSRNVDLIFQATDDITDQITKGQELELTQHLLNEALSVGLVGTWILEIGSNKVIADKNLGKIFGIPEDELLSNLSLKVFTNAIHPDDRERVLREIDVALKTHHTYETEYRTVDREGVLRWVIVRGKVEENEEGEAVRFSGILLDITDRKAAENNINFLSKASIELAKSLDYRKTLKNIANLVVPDIADWCTIDILDENNELQLVGLAHKDPEKVKWAQALRKEQGPPDLNEPSGLPNVLRTGKPEFYPVITQELIDASNPTKEERKLLKTLGLSSIIIVPLKLYDETIGAVTLISAEQKRHYTKADLEMAQELANRASLAMTNASLYKNIQAELTMRKQLQDELRVANEELENRVRERTAELELLNTELQRSNKELEDFAYVASHDLQEPLRKIQAFSNLLEEEFADELGEGKDYVLRMRGAAARMSSLIEDLLALSRVSTKQVTFSLVNLNTVAHEVVGDLEAAIQKTKGTITLEKLPRLQADPTQMRQLLQNLIGNALKFHKNDVPPRVKIWSEQGQNKNATMKSWTIYVEDNGVGFDEKYLDRIFAVFQRLHGRDDYEGTGVGLAVCRKIIERHGGTLNAKSKPGQGSTFIITLPAKQKEGQALYD